MMKKFISLALAVMLVCSVGSIPVGASAQKQATVPISGTYASKKAYTVLKLVNKARKTEGRNKLKWDQALERAAIQRAQEIAVRFSHTRPNGKNCFSALSKKDQAGFFTVGENIAAGNLTAAGVMRDWMDSPSHYMNIVHAEFTHIGIACVKISGVYYWVQEFGGGERAPSKKFNKTGGFTASVTGIKAHFKLSICEPNKPVYDHPTKVKTLGVGQTQKVRLVVYGKENFLPAYAKRTKFTWKSSDPKIVTVNKYGTLTAKKAGTVTITVTAKNKSIRVKQKIKVTE